ncbi:MULTISPECIES: bifunctional aspartate transaminase/aspartate 4-decarboxylase [unclassified Agarivorans]|uniref:bifunctional aspartate transaminase/aspartate 4-decarboxylase n=1 Tax=unclassified Agarivorans TaxID=2636026 RepID=UPI0026E45D87|nr:MULTISPECIES: bifunctional aspartate transaminase/aspartate 4-decarboxylase [unclassified Agarivorans]MDO6686055.1 bifunctional aspartate transaminase/aspartate 4-decarboxylase [Agarivorans sp. 3_MG-2023]MDO6713807.1 bifunctional aspartate transaminase/aspartate 4-decarboxylase [Agarivorans sp. 2_MG-2023]MDO6762139.1 bifunctional aspartate transaminase/aspartate 4-decarboxylase [Agarivorans sp. 1_MG-2023]
MLDIDFTQFADLSPFELKDKLIDLANTVPDRSLLDAGRGNPNFLATLPRKAFLRLGDFSIEEAERNYAYLDGGFGGIPNGEGIVERFDTFAKQYGAKDGVQFLQKALSYAKDRLGIEKHDFLNELVLAFLGCNYPVPSRMLTNIEKVVKQYIGEEMYGSVPMTTNFDLFATEGGTASMTYTFATMFNNGLLKKGDKVALITPIFTPYLEIPELAEYDLEIVELRLDETTWQLPQSEIEKLADTSIKLLCVVNPANPASVKMSDETLALLTDFVNTQRKDLFIITDDVYSTFADDFVSLFATLPYNTLCVYSFSKYFGATGWRLGTIGIHETNVFDDAMRALPEAHQERLDNRYKTLTPTPRDIKFIDRIVADSRAVALNHTAGLALPQQVQMALFSLTCLMDLEDNYKAACKRIIRERYKTLYGAMGLEVTEDKDRVDYYTLLELDQIGSQLYGEDFVRWFKETGKGQYFLFRLAQSTGVILLPGKGFDTVHASVRVSLANLTHHEYELIGRETRKVLDEHFAEYNAQ